MNRRGVGDAFVNVYRTLRLGERFHHGIDHHRRKATNPYRKPYLATSRLLRYLYLDIILIQSIMVICEHSATSKFRRLSRRCAS